MGVNADPATLDAHAVAQYTTAGSLPGVTDFVLNIIPATFFGAFASGDVLQTLLLAILFGFALHAVGGKANPLFQIVEEAGQVFFRIVGYVMRLAPLGALGAMAFTVGRYGAESLLALARLMGVLLSHLRDLRARRAGCHRPAARLLRAALHPLHPRGTLCGARHLLVRIRATTHAAQDGRPRGAQVDRGPGDPAGYSFNLDGTSIYLTMAAIYIAQATNTPLDIWHQLTLLTVLLLTSKGAAAVTGGGFITLAASLSAVGHVPVAGLALILGIDRFMSEARALTNLVGNGVATIVVAKWCGGVDEAQLQGVLAGSAPAPLGTAPPPAEDKLEIERRGHGQQRVIALRPVQALVLDPDTRQTKLELAPRAPGELGAGCVCAEVIWAAR